MSVSLSFLSLVNSTEPIVYSVWRAIIYDRLNRDAQLAYLLKIMNLVSGCVSSVVCILFAEDLMMQFLADYEYIRGSH
jgi:hypothetical protein